jgi:hypothetical protein
MLSINDDIRIPAYVVAVEDAIGNPGDSLTPDLSGHDKTVRKEVPAEAAKSLAAYWTNIGWLVPRNWRLVRAAIGVDNSSVYEFNEPNDGTGVVSLYDSGGACVGCALSLAAPYSPDAKRKQATCSVNLLPALKHSSIQSSQASTRSLTPARMQRVNQSMALPTTSGR